MSDQLTKSLKTYIARVHGVNATSVWVDVDKDVQNGCSCCEGASVTISYDLFWRDGSDKIGYESFGDLNDLLNLAVKNVE